MSENIYKKRGTNQKIQFYHIFLIFLSFEVFLSMMSLIYAQRSLNDAVSQLNQKKVSTF